MSGASLLSAPTAGAVRPVYPGAAAGAGAWFSPLVFLTAPVAQVLAEPQRRLPSQLPVLVLALAQVLPWPHPPILGKGLAQLPGLTQLPVAGPADLRSRP